MIQVIWGIRWEEQAASWKVADVLLFPGAR